MSEVDLALVQAAQAGSREAFEALFDRYKQQIYAYIHRIMGSAEDANDLTQDTFLKAYVALPKAKGEMNFVPWLYRIATNVCRDELRRRKIVRWQSLGAVTAVFLPQTVAPDNPEDEYARKERAAEVQLTLRRLREKYRLCLVLRESQELSCEEIGQVLGVSRQAAKSLLFRAREEFRTIYRSIDTGRQRDVARFVRCRQGLTPPIILDNARANCVSDAAVLPLWCNGQNVVAHAN